MASRDTEGLYQPCWEEHAKPFQPVAVSRRNGQTTINRCSLNAELLKFVKEIKTRQSEAGFAITSDYLALQRVPAMQQPASPTFQALIELLNQLRAFNNGQVNYENTPFLKDHKTLNPFPVIGECSLVHEVVTERLLANSFPKFLEVKMEPFLKRMLDAASAHQYEAHQGMMQQMRITTATPSGKNVNILPGCQNQLPIPQQCNLLDMMNLDMTWMPILENRTVVLKYDYNSQQMNYHRIVDDDKFYLVFE